MLASCRLGDFTLLSTKNVDSKENYTLLKKCSQKKAFDLKTATDKTIESVDGGVYLQNAVISQGLLMYKVKGDVWGTPKK